MRRIPLSLAFLTMALLASLVLAVAPAAAITYGTPTGSAYGNVGAMITYRENTGNYRRICSGTLIAPQVFLTASHCTVAYGPDDEIFVSFHPEITPVQGAPFPAEWIPAIPVTNPAYNQRQSDSGDIAVLILSRPATEVYPGITPAALPSLGLLDQLSVRNGLRGQKFLAVGYGAQERTHEPGSGAPQFGTLAQRRYAYSEFNALNKGYIRLSQNPATGNAGTCYGDSGGPNFLVNPDGSLILAAVTVTGDIPCRATNVDYRTDTESARAFFAYVEREYGVDIPLP